MKKVSFRSLALIFMVILSLVLTGFIFSGQAFAPKDPQIRESNDNSEESIQSDIRVLGPSQIIFHHGDEIEMINTQEFLNLGSEYLISEEALKNLRLQDEAVGPHDLFSQLNQETTIVHTFDSFVPFSVYSDVFEDLDESFYDQSFNFIFFPIERGEVVYFYNSETGHLYIANATGGYLEALADKIDFEEIETQAVSPFFIGGTPIYLPDEKTRVSYYDYLLNRIPNSIVVDQLFPDLSEVNLRSYSTYVNYWSYESNLRIEDRTNLITFETREDSSGNLNLEQTLTWGLETLSDYETWNLGVHFNEVDRDQERISFRRYLKGFPVFSKNGEDLITIGLDHDSLTFLQMSLSIAETPIDVHEDQYYRDLASGQEVVDRINQSNLNHEGIESIRIGLTWNYSEESERVVHFAPDWYIRYDGQWQLLDDLLEE